MIYCGDWWTQVWAPFNTVKVEITLTVCALGCVTNTINFLVFTQKRMRNPTNLILTALTVTDFLSVFRLLLRLSLVSYAEKFGEWRSPYALAVEEMIHDCFFVVSTKYKNFKFN